MGKIERERERKRERGEGLRDGNEEEHQLRSPVDKVYRVDFRLISLVDLMEWKPAL